MQKKNYGLSETDYANVEAFFRDEILGHSSAHILSVYTKLFSNIKYREFMIWMLYKVTKLRANDINFFTKLVAATVTNSTFEEKLSFFFDLFSEFSD
jgi:hypothetical protein